MSPVQIGYMQVKNRIVFPPMNTNLSSEDGCVTPQMEEYYVRRAKGGAGLIILEASSVAKDTRNHPRQPMICDRKYTASWARLVERLHRYGTKVSIELVHYGSEASIPPRVSPSGLSKYKDAPGKVLTVEEIHHIQQQFVEAALYAKQAGMDAITLHGCHGYLIAEFLSPVFNQRTDEYGGSFENRCRFLLEIIEKCRRALGPRFPIMVRYSANEYIDGGRELDEAVRLAKVLADSGVDAIDLSASQPSAYLMTTPPYCLPQAKGLLVPYSEAIRQVVSVPVFTAIGIREPEYAEQILTEGKADLIALGRPQLADPDYAHKVCCGHPEKIRHCLSCEYCLDTLDDDRQICCAVNPETGRETEFAGAGAVLAERFSAGASGYGRKNVIVIGGGPAGMEAARVAALKGHKVTLFEKRGELGGTLNAAKIPPHKEMIGKLVDWYRRELDELGVEVRLGMEMTEEAVDTLEPDVVFLGCGSHYIKRIKGSDLPNVINAYEALTKPDKVGKNVVIVGGGASGAEVAEYFAGALVDVVCMGADELGGKLEFKAEERPGASADHKITVVEMLDGICSDMDVFCREPVLYTLEKNGVRLCPSCRVEEITEKDVRIFNLKEEKEEVLTADTVILAGGLKPNGQEMFQNKPYPVVRIGDAVQAGKIKDAVYTAYVQAEQI